MPRPAESAPAEQAAPVDGEADGGEPTAESAQQD